MSVISITKRNLTLEIQKIDEKANYITKLKDEAVQTLLEQKENMVDVPGKDMSKLSGKIDGKIEKLKEQHTAVMSKYSEKQLGIQKEKEDYDALGEDLDDIDMELKVIQERHDVVMEQLNNKRAFLVQRLDSINNMEQEVMDLEAALLRAKSGIESQMSNLEMKKQDIVKSLPENEAAAKLVEIEASMQEALKRHATEVEEINAQIADMKSLEYLQNKCRETSQELEGLEEAACNAATSAERLKIESRIKLLTMQQDECENLLRLASMTSKERVIKLLEQRGLLYTPSGRIRTTSGRLVTMAEALAMGLLDGMEHELSDLFGVTITESRQIRTTSGHVLSTTEAGKLGIFKEAGDTSESTVSSASSDTTLSGMSSADVHYLKANLGKPLAMALAEITAKQPRDPIHYLGHWLFKYRYNQETDQARKVELEALLVERDRLARIAQRKEAEDEAEHALLDLLGRVEMEEARQKIEGEIRRIEAEAAALERESEALDREATDTLGVYTGPTAGQKL